MKEILHRLISEKNSEDLKKFLREATLELRHQKLLLEVLESDVYFSGSSEMIQEHFQQDLIEGAGLYFKMKDAGFPEKILKNYLKGICDLAYSTSQFMMQLSQELNQKGALFTEFEPIDPRLRSSIQELIDSVKDDQDNYAAFGNLVLAKASISNIPGLPIPRHEIGMDMLQYAEGAERGRMTDQALRIFQAIMEDFECETVKTGSPEFREMFPEVTAIDTRSKEEIQVFEIARERYEKLSGQKMAEIKRVHVVSEETRENREAENTQGNLHSFKEQREQVQTKEKGFLSRLKKLFRG